MEHGKSVNKVKYVFETFLILNLKTSKSIHNPRHKLSIYKPRNALQGLNSNCYNQKLLFMMQIRTFVMQTITTHLTFPLEQF